eukprot:2275482-Rhodomonas_salina.2
MRASPSTPHASETPREEVAPRELGTKAHLRVICVDEEQLLISKELFETLTHISLRGIRFLVRPLAMSGLAIAQHMRGQEAAFTRFWSSSTFEGEEA